MSDKNLRPHGGIRFARGDFAGGGKSPRRRLPPLGRVHAVPDSRPRQSDGLQKFARRLVLARVRRRRVCGDDGLDLVHCNAFDYPLIVGGKPMFSPPMSFVPSYILMVLGGAVGAFVGMLALNQLPRLHHPLFGKKRFELVSRDKFFLVIGANDQNFPKPKPASCSKQSAARTSNWWRTTTDALRSISIMLIGAALGAAVVGIAGFRGGLSRKPPIEVFPDMDRQLKLRPQKPNDFFTNGVSSQLPPAGTIARSEPIQTASGAVYPFEDAPVNTGRVTGTTNFVETNPLPVNGPLLQRGHERFDIYCAPCHGKLGDGNGITKKIGVDAGRGKSARQAHRGNGRRRNFQHHHPWQKHDGRVWPDPAGRRTAGRSSPICARCN